MTTTDGRVRHDPDGLNSAGAAIELANAYYTPLRSFFTRSHAPVPQIDVDSFRLVVDGMVATPLSLPFGQLRQLAHRTVASTLLCAGLRRDELLRLGPLPGELPWGPEAASNAQWTGVPLADVLALAGLSPDATHIHFVGLDDVERRGERFGFGGSITAAKALQSDVILAFEMSGTPLPPEHGFPVRAIVPGWIGARSVKWLGRITAASEPSQNYFQTSAYRVQRITDPAHPGDVTAGVPLAEITINAVILDPAPDQRVVAGPRTLRGWAIGRDGAAITGVDCSIDDGATWQPATLEAERDRWTWTRWHADVELPAGSHTLVVRAHDTSGVAQPAQTHEVWNVKGYLNNAWHRVRVVAST